MISAPRSPSTIVQKGPARILLRSSTLTPLRGLNLVVSESWQCAVPMENGLDKCWHLEGRISECLTNIIAISIGTDELGNLALLTPGTFSIISFDSFLNDTEHRDKEVTKSPTAFK